MLVASGLVMLVGNLLQVGHPGEHLPFDMVSGLGVRRAADLHAVPPQSVPDDLVVVPEPCWR
jgi:hypothetical protein